MSKAEKYIKRQSAQVVIREAARHLKNGVDDATKSKSNIVSMKLDDAKEMLWRLEDARASLIGT